MKYTVKDFFYQIYPWLKHLVNCTLVHDILVPSELTRSINHLCQYKRLANW